MSAWSRLSTTKSSQPHNPEVANAFFRAGEIEAWGRAKAMALNPGTE
jgi:hypothetical protein